MNSVKSWSFCMTWVWDHGQQAIFHMGIHMGGTGRAKRGEGCSWWWVMTSSRVKNKNDTHCETATLSGIMPLCDISFTDIFIPVLFEIYTPSHIAYMSSTCENRKLWWGQQKKKNKPVHLQRMRFHRNAHVSSVMQCLTVQHIAITACRGGKSNTL